MNLINDFKGPDTRSLADFLKKLITPGKLTAEDGIAYWQERVLLILLLICAVAGFITYIPSLLLSIKEELWVIAVLDTVIYAFALFLFFRSDLSYRVRAVAIPVIAYILGIILLTTLGPFGAGPVWLFFFPVITAVLMGSKAAGIALCINALTMITLGLMIHLGFTDILTSLNFRAWYIADVNPVEKWIVICLNFVFLNVISTVCVFMILNGLQKTINQLARSGKKYRQIFENILDVYFETSMDGEIQVVSPSVETVSRYTQEQLYGQSMFDIYADPEDRQQALREIRREGFLQDHEIKLLDREGEPHFCSVNARVIFDGTGKPEKIIGILRDISDKKAMEKNKEHLEERLNRSRKMEALGLLAGGVAHDLNNILTGVVTYPEVLCIDLRADDPMYKSLEIIRSSGQKASDIVQDLLTLSRRGVVSKDALNVNELVANFSKTPEYEKILSFHPYVSVVMKLQATTPFINGSRVHLEKTLMNLISNAAEAHIDPGYITITTENRHLDTPLSGYDRVEKGDYLVLSVKDEGSGISDEDVSRIFEPFFTKKVMGRSGTGLGMAVVWGTIQDHYGYIDIIRGDKKGTTFELYFPVNSNAPSSKPDSRDIKALQGEGQTILIVDDIENQRKVAEFALNRMGYRTFSVNSGEEAVEFIKNRHVDLLLLDMIMDPGIDGFETYKRILSISPGQKAVIASGYSQTRKVEQTLSLGAGQYIKKPYTLETLGLAVKQELSP